MTNAKKICIDEPSQRLFFSALTLLGKVQMIQSSEKTTLPFLMQISLVDILQAATKKSNRPYETFRYFESHSIPLANKFRYALKKKHVRAASLRHASTEFVDLDEAVFLFTFIHSQIKVNQVCKFIRHFQSNVVFPGKVLYQSNPVTNDFDIAEVFNNFFPSTSTTLLPSDQFDESLIAEDIPNSF